MFGLISKKKFISAIETLLRDSADSNKATDYCSRKLNRASRVQCQHFNSLTTRPICFIGKYRKDM